MFLRLMYLFFAVLAAEGASSSGKCPHVKNPVEPDLEKLSGLWHVLGSYPATSSLSHIQFKGDAANYTMTITGNETLALTVNYVARVDKENRKVMKPVANSEDPYGDLYLLAAVYDKFTITYSCFLNAKEHLIAFVLARSKDVDEDTSKKIKNILEEYPQLEENKDFY